MSSKKNLILLSLILWMLSIVPLSLTAQNGFLSIEVGRTYDVYAVNKSIKNYHIVIEFTKLFNLGCECGTVYAGNISSGRTKLVQLKSDNGIMESIYDYRWSYREGWANPEVKKGILYAIPVSSGKMVEVLGLSSLKEVYGDEEDAAEAEGFYALGFKMNKGDTVFASRRGYVAEIQDGDEPIGENLTYSRKRNMIMIRHLDKTLMKYSVLKNGSFFVSPGDLVEPGDPLAIVGGDNYISGPHVRLAAYYLSFDKSQENGKRYSWTYIQPVFATKDQGNTLLEDGISYTSVHSEQLIRQEWTRRELKKKGKKKK